MLPVVVLGNRRHHVRTVAIVVAALAFAATLIPAQAAGPEDQCRDSGTHTQCESFDISDAHQGVSPVNGLPYWDRYYVWISPGSCGSAGAILTEPCNGYPGEGNGVPLPTGGAAGAGVFSVLYQETNGANGLQRARLFYGGQQVLPDRTVLV